MSDTEPTACMCSLCLYGAGLDVDVATRLLGGPTRSGKVGNVGVSSVTGESFAPLRRSFWCLESNGDEPSSDDPAVHLRWLMNRVPIEQLRAVPGIESVRISVLLQCRSESAGFSIEPDLLNYIQEIRAALDVSIECWRP